MARIRTIKPEFPHSESMGRVSRDARLLFLQLFTLVDDVGRCRAASRLLASLLYPYDDDAAALMDGWKAELAREDCLILYEVDGTQYLEVRNWLKHQKIDHPSKSKFPAPDDMFANPREGVGETRASRARAGPRKGSGSGPVEDLDQDPGEEGTGGARSRQGAGVDANSAGWPADYQDQFQEGYPNKVAMAPALKALDSLKAAGTVTWDFLMDALEAYAVKDDDRAWMNPKTWIEQERWNDRAAKPPRPAAAKPKPGDRARRLARQMEAREREGAVGRPDDSIGGDEIGGDDARLVSGGKPSSG